MRKRSCPPPSASPSADRSAAAWGAGRRSTRPSAGRSSCWSAANGSSDSDSTPRALSTCMSPAPRARVVEQDRLPDPRLTAQRERAAPRVAGRVEQCADEGALSVPPKQHRPTLPTGVATI